MSYIMNKYRHMQESILNSKCSDLYSDTKTWLKLSYLYIHIRKWHLPCRTKDEHVCITMQAIAVDIILSWQSLEAS